MKRLAPIAVILSIFAGTGLAGPSYAGGISFDLPVLTWPTQDGATILGTKSASKP